MLFCIWKVSDKNIQMVILTIETIWDNIKYIVERYVCFIWKLLNSLWNF